MINKIIEDIKRLNALEDKSTALKIVKFNEEFGEMCAEYLKMIGYSAKVADRDHMIEEMADGLQCILSIYLGIEKELDISLVDEVLPRILEKNKKWELKMKECPVHLNKNV